MEETNDNVIHVQFGRGARTAEESSAERSPGIDSINAYFKTIRKIRLLTADEEKRLARRIAKGDAEARRQMIEANLRLVVNIAKRYLNRGLPLQDLIEEGNIGLIKSVERMFAQFRRDVIARQISRADEEGESLRPRVVWGFALGLDVQVAVFHGAKFPLSWQERG